MTVIPEYAWGERTQNLNGFCTGVNMAALAYLRTTRVRAAMSPRRWFLPEISTVMKATR